MHRTFFIAFVFFIGGMMDFFFLRSVVTRPAVDFAQFYFAGQLVSQGNVSQIYQREAYEPLVAKLTPEQVQDLRPFYYFNRPAFAAPFYWPYSFFSYATGARIFVALNFVLWGMLIWKLPPWLGAPGVLRIWLVSLFPFAYSVGVGQDTLAMTLIIAYATCVLIHRNETAAGVALGLCLIKPHLIVLLPLLLLVEGKRRALFSFIATGIALGGLSFALVGVQGIGQWLEILRAPTTDYHPEIMGTVRALGIRFGALAGWTAGTVALAAGVIAFANSGYRDRLSIALLLALILGPHAYWGDYSLLAIVALNTTNRLIRYSILLPWSFFFPRTNDGMWPMVFLVVGFLALMALDSLPRTSQVVSWQGLTRKLVREHPQASGTNFS